MAKNGERIIFGEPERELTDDVARVEANQARANLQKTIDNLNAKGWHNQFDYANYGVQYNPIYDKETGRVKSLEESGLSPQEFTHMANMMNSAPEMTEEWNEERARMIGNRVFSTLEMYDDDTSDAQRQIDREKFVKEYVEAVKKYHMDDENFDYEVIKSIFHSAGGKNIGGGRHDWSGTDAVTYD